MKSRVLFVDDNPLVLQGLSRSLYGMRAQFEFEFTESGPAALELMAQRAFDAVVTDLKMPGMDGVELLEEVLRRHPQTVRLVLSGQADQAMVYRCVGVAHQCLSKPCDSETLKRTVLRAVELTRSVKSEALKKLVVRMDRIPTVPSLYCELVQQLQSPNARLDVLAAVVQQDPGVTAKLLQLVNSSFFGLRRPISSPVDAIAYLGVESLKSLVLSLSAFSQYREMDAAGVSLTSVWQHSLRTAEIARRLVGARGLASGMADTAFVGGLLHDIGRVVLACNFPADYAAVRQLAVEQEIRLEAAEEKAFACTHADVGGYLLGLWGLPGAVVEAIAYHHVPAAAKDAAFTPLTAVHIANVLDAQGDRLTHARSPSLDGVYLERLGLRSGIQAWREILQGCLGTYGEDEKRHPLR